MEVLHLQHLLVGHNGHDLADQPPELEQLFLDLAGLVQTAGLVVIPELLAQGGEYRGHGHDAAVAARLQDGQHLGVVAGDQLKALGQIQTLKLLEGDEVHAAVLQAHHIGAGIAHLLHHLGGDGVVGHAGDVVEVEGQGAGQLGGLLEVGDQGRLIVGVIVGGGDRGRVSPLTSGPGKQVGHIGLVHGGGVEEDKGVVSGPFDGRGEQLFPLLQSQVDEFSRGAADEHAPDTGLGDKLGEFGVFLVVDAAVRVKWGELWGRDTPQAGGL